MIYYFFLTQATRSITVSLAANTRMDGKFRDLILSQSYLPHRDNGAARVIGDESHRTGNKTKAWVSDDEDK